MTATLDRASVTFTGEVHPLAALWPMLADEDLRSLADDIAEHGLNHPIVLDAAGRLIDGRNRLAACDLAGVEPSFAVVDIAEQAEVAAYVAGANAERRHLTTGQLAAGRALMLAEQGKRKNGRWAYGTISQDLGSLGEAESLRRAGLILDWAPHLLPQVLSGDLALDAAHHQAKAAQDAALADERAEQQRQLRLKDLRKSRPDLAALVKEGRLPLDDALTVRDRDLAAERKAEQVRIEGIKKLNWLASDAIHNALHIGHPNNRDDFLDAWAHRDLRPPLSDDLGPAAFRNAAQCLNDLADSLERA